MALRAHFTIVLIVAIAACNGSVAGGARAPLTSGAVAGCYRFSWTRADSLLQDATFFPDLVRLDLSPSCPTCAPDAPAAKNLSLGSPFPDTTSTTPGGLVPWHRRYYASWWRISSPDTVTVVFNSNHDRWDVRLSPSNGVLKGQARYWSDGGTVPTAAVVATSASCGIAA